MTNLSALREAVAKMTEWPWLDNGTEATDEDCQETIIETSPRYTGVDFEIPVAGDMDRRRADIAGIVALRNAAPALLDELEMLHADLAALKGILHAAHGVLTDAATIAVPGAYDDPLAPAVQQLVDERDAYRAALTKVATAGLDAEQDNAARAVLDGAELTGDTSYDHPPDPRVAVTFDRAAWLAWQEAKR